MKKLIILLFLLILLPSVFGVTSGTNYSVGNSVSSLQGGNATGSIYEAITYFTTNIGGSANGSIYSGVIGFFGKFKKASLPLPTLNLISPKNGTYLDNSILLSYSVSGQQAVWYSLDSDENITLTGPIFFSANQGDHIFYIYANNSAGEIISKTISFLVDKNKFKIKTDKFKEEKKGESTNFSGYSYEELQNLSNLILEDSDKGKIKFNDVVNLTDIEGEEIDLDLFINISHNRIEINSTALPNLNKPATLQFYNINFTNPRILKDGAVCPSNICVKENYLGGILKFNVTGFSVYSSEETPAEIQPTTTTSPSGGGTGEAIMNLNIEDFSIDAEEIKISLTPGTIATKKIVITNNGNKKISLNIKEEGLQNFLMIRENKIEINPNESKEIMFDIAVRENVLPNLYVGKLIISGENKEEEIFIILEVESKGALFDVRVNIPDEYLEINPGNELLAEVELFNLGEIKRADVEIEYIIADKEGNKISTEKETIAVETKAGFVKRIKIPKDTENGNYILYVKASYEGKFASATSEFDITHSLNTQTYIIVILIMIILISLICYLIKRKRKKTKRVSKKLKRLKGIRKKFLPRTS